LPTALSLTRWCGGYPRRSNYKYSITYSPTGIVTWQGDNSLGRTGKFESSIAPSLYNKLSAAILSSSAYQLAASGNYKPRRVLDSPTAELKVRCQDGQEIVMLNSLFQRDIGTPTSILEIVELLEGTAATLKWQPE